MVKSLKENFDIFAYPYRTKKTGYIEK